MQKKDEITPCDLEQQRAYIYAILSALLSAPTTQQLIKTINACDIENHTWLQLKEASKIADLEKLDDEYHRLFIGIGAGELIPYYSHYMSGFLMDKNLAELRQDLEKMGLMTLTDQKNPEDHVAAIFEIMRFMISQLDLPFEEQKSFFNKYIYSWIEEFLTDLEKKSSEYYHFVANFGKWFIGVEKQYFNSYQS